MRVSFVGVQAPATQVALLPQVTPQPPQLASSVVVVTHSAPQAVVPGMPAQIEVQVPEPHDSVAPHA